MKKQILSNSQTTVVKQTLVTVYLPGADGPESSQIRLAVLRDDGHMTLEPLVVIEDDTQTV